MHNYHRIYAIGFGMLNEKVHYENSMLQTAGIIIRVTIINLFRCQAAFSSCASLMLSRESLELSYLNDSSGGGAEPGPAIFEGGWLGLGSMATISAGFCATGLCDGKGADCIILFIVGRCVNLGGGG